MSYYLQAQRVGALVSGQRTVSAVDVAQLPNTFQLACVTGYLIILGEAEPGLRGSKDEPHSRGFLRLRDAIVAKRYRFLDSPTDPDVGYLAPEAFWGSSWDITTFLDGAMADRVYEDLSEWEASQKLIDDHIASNNATRRHVVDLAALLMQRQNEEAAATVAVNELNRELTELDDQISALEASMSTLLLNPNNTTSLLRALKRPRPALKREYSKAADFYLPVILERLVSIENRAYDGKQVGTKYATPELRAALDELVATETENLKKLGINRIELASGARSPMQQAILGATNPVAVGLFNSGHVFGVAFDLSVTGAVVDLKDGKTRAAVNRILKRHGLVLPDSLAESDPNHGFLVKFLKDRRWALSHMLGMMRGYAGALAKQKTKQAILKSALSKEARQLDSRTAVLDAQIAAAQTRIAHLQSEHTRLQRERATRQLKLANKRAEIAAKNAAKEQEPKRGREWWGEGHADRPDKDNYWERWTREEFHEPGRDWSRDTYENSRGERYREETEVHHGTEMRSDERDHGMHDSRGLP